MGKKIDKDKLNELVSIYNEYFKDVADTYDSLLSKSQEYLRTSDKNIQELSNLPIGTKGVQHYLNEHLENASSLISQCQSLTDSKYKMKKSILDYAIKDMGGDSEEGEDYLSTINELIAAEKEKQKEQASNIQNILDNKNELDAEIERILNENVNERN